MVGRPLILCVLLNDSLTADFLVTVLAAFELLEMPVIELDLER